MLVYNISKDIPEETILTIIENLSPVLIFEYHDCYTARHKRLRM